MINKREIIENTKNLNVLVAGSLNRDLIVHVEKIPGNDDTELVKTLISASGGHGGNCAVAANQFGANISFLGTVGCDENGRNLIRELEQKGIDVSRVQLSSEQNTGFVIIPSSVNKRFMLMNRGANDVDLDWKEILASGRFLYDKSIIILLDPSESLIEEIIRFKRLVKTSFIVWSPGGGLSNNKKFYYLAKHADSIILNQAEFKKVINTGWDTFVEDCESFNVNLVVTMGKLGAKTFVNGKEIFCSSIKVDSVDETGAGDAFVAAYAILVRFVEKITCIELANIFAAFATKSNGARVGNISIDEILNIYKLKY